MMTLIPSTEPKPSSVLSLTARISCAKEPSVSIPCCKLCQGREARKSQKKLQEVLNDSVHASIPSVLRGGSILDEGAGQGPYVSPLEFNGDELIPLRSGEVDFSFRITCYCSHHREPSGFRWVPIIFRMNVD
jgi:hypothetical protein